MISKKNGKSDSVHVVTPDPVESGLSHRKKETSIWGEREVVFVCLFIREREREHSHLMVHPPDASNVQGWVGG